MRHFLLSFLFYSKIIYFCVDQHFAIMKKQFLYLFLFFAFISCQEEVKFNNPSFEGQKDNVFWRAVDSKAVLANDGSLCIEGYTAKEKLTLKTTSTTPQIYPLGTNTSTTATYVLTTGSDTITFATGFEIGEGQIVIEEYDSVNSTISGTFKFNAENIDSNPLAGPVLNFQYGRFYKIPISKTAL
jgi:hypothetical protein